MKFHKHNKHKLELHELFFLNRKINNKNKMDHRIPTAYLDLPVVRLSSLCPLYLIYLFLLLKMT